MDTYGFTTIYQWMQIQTSVDNIDELMQKRRNSNARYNYLYFLTFLMDAITNPYE